MKYLGIIAIGTLAAACSSNSPPPAASAASVDAASDTPSSSSAIAAVPNDATVAAAKDDHASNPRSTQKAVTTGTTGTTGAGNTGTTPADMAANDAAATAAPTTPPAAPDNTRVNARDKDGKTLTPMDQGGSEGDRKITQQIRQAVMKDSSLSFTAKNVKIITVNGKVTLRGPVKTDAERSAIETAAKSAAGASQVDDQLEVKK